MRELGIEVRQALPGVGEAVALFTDLLVREDLLQLFGFTSMAEKEWHRLLTSVQGIGAKGAMAILGTLGADGVGRAISLGDAAAIKAGTKRLDRIFMIALALAVGYFAFDKFMLDPARDAAIVEAAREEGRAEATQRKRDAGPPVVAVLPFNAVTTC